LTSPPPENARHRFTASETFAAKTVVRDGNFSVLDEVDTAISGALVFCQTLHYVKKANRNPHIAAIVCTPALVDAVTRKDIAIIAVEDPRYCFFDVYVRLMRKGLLLPEAPFESDIGQDCVLHPRAVISPRSRLGDRVVIGANAVIEDNCVIGDDVEIGPNAVIGAQGLLTLRRPDGRLERIAHAGGVEIEDGCQILAGAVIAKSLFQRFTHIGRHSQIGIMTTIGHGAWIDQKCVISGNSVIAGCTRLAQGVWVGTCASIAQGLSIGENAQIKMGSVVVAHLPAEAVVSGNFAVNHRVTMAHYLGHQVR